MSTPDPNLSGLARGGVLNLVGAGAAGVFGVALVAVVTRGYPTELAGAFFAATSVFLVLGAACELGSDAGLVRSLSRYLAQGRTADARRVLPVALAPVFGLACVVAVTVFVLSPLVAAGPSPGRAVVMLRVLALFLPVAAVHHAVLAATRGYRTMRPTVAVERIGRLGFQFAAVVFVQAAGGGPVALAVAWAGPYLLGLIAGAGWLIRLDRRRNWPGDADTEAALPGRHLAAEFWRFTAPRALGRVCQVALQRADIVLVAALSSPRDAAIYTAATRFVVLGQLGTQAVQQVMQPTVSRQLATSDYAGAARVFRVSTAWTMALTWPVFIAFAVAAPLYLAVFGEVYQARGWPVVVILAVTMLVATAAGPTDAMLLMAGRSGLSLANNASALVVNVVLNLVLIPWLGIVGAALSWSAAIVTRNALPLAQVRLSLRMSPASAGAAWVACSAAASFVVPPLATSQLLGPRPLPLAVALVPCVVAYLALTWVGRGRIELSALTELLRRRSSAGPHTVVEEAP